MKDRTVVISDLHLGGGKSDPGDDHVYQGGELTRFVGQLLDSPLGQRGAIELYINGDFLEFAQTDQDVYAGKDADYWCSEAESRQKLDAILAGHASVFEALRDFLDRGNAVTIAAGNHDVDLYWPSVQAALRRETAQSLAFELGQEWVGRYDDRLQIAHGHLPDPANTFRHWGDPRMVDGEGQVRLEMCPGTLFMVKVVNLLEKDYPFADNVHPIQRFARLLAKDEISGFLPAAWSFFRFATRHSSELSSSAADRYGAWLLPRIGSDDALAAALCAVVQQDDGSSVSVETLRQQLTSEHALAKFIVAHWPGLQESGIAAQLQPPPSNVLGGGDGKTLGAVMSGKDFGRDALRKVAKDRADSIDATEVVVMGHTHIPDQWPSSSRMRYYNPGSWTRYVDLDRHPNLRLADLGEDAFFPYSLKYVQIDAPAGRPLVASLETFEEQVAQFPVPNR